MIRAYHRGDSSVPRRRTLNAQEIPIRKIPSLTILICACVATAAAAAVSTTAPGGSLRVAPVVLSPGPPNGDLAAGLEGWTVLGRDGPVLLAPGARLIGNLTLVSPPLALPPGAQTLRIAARAPGTGGLVAVRARTDDGTPDIDLATLELGASRRSWPVGVAALAGRTVRVVIDPVPALGTSVDIFRVGPVTAPLPGWSVDRGTLEVVGARGRRVVVVTDEALALRSPAFSVPTGPRRRTVSVAVRGDGVLRVAAAGRSVVRRSGAAWRDVTITLPRRGRTRIALALIATPGAGGLELRSLGTARREEAPKSPARSDASEPR